MKEGERNEGKQEGRKGERMGGKEGFTCFFRAQQTQKVNYYD